MNAVKILVTNLMMIRNKIMNYGNSIMSKFNVDKSFSVFQKQLKSDF